MRPEALASPALRVRRAAFHGRRLPPPALLLGAFAVLAALVAGGLTTGLDQYAVHHLMPGLYPYVSGRFRRVPGSLPAEPLNPGRILNRTADAVARPATVEVVTPLVAIALLAAGRRLRRGRWVAAYAALLAAELVGKHLVHRAPLYTTAAYGALHVWKFDSSFPSGETGRAVFLCGLVATAWPVVAPLAVLWAAGVALLLEVAGTHTPTDVAGGLLLGAALVLLCRRGATPGPEGAAP